MVTSLKPPAGGLIGRDQEMTALLEGLGEARDGRPSTFLVGGDAGIGKTRLLSEFAARSNERVLWGGCLPLGERGVPYLAVIEMLRSLDPEERDSLPAALETLAPKGHEAVTERAISRMHLFQSMLELLEGLANESPLIVVFEDIHWADRSTRDLLDFLIGLMRDQRIMLVASVRTDGLPNDHPLRPQLAEWSRRPSVSRIDVGPLTLEECLRLIAPLLAGSGETREEAMQLAERADGNPFFLEELAASGGKGSLPTGRMRDLFLGRVHDLSPDLLRLLRIASAGGTNIDEHLLSDVAGIEIDETRVLLRAGIDAQLLVVDDRSCRFRHALMAEAIHHDLLPAERREYHAAYADSLAKQQRPVAPGQLAAHQAEAGRIDQALSAWVKAGDAAEAQFAFAESRDAYQAALDLWELVEDPDSNAGLGHVDLLRKLAEAAFLAGSARFACATIRRAIAEIDPDEDPVTAGLAYDRLARYLRNTDEFAEALAMQQRAVELVPASPPTQERAEVLSGLALIYQFENRYHEAHDLAVEAIDVAVETGALDAEIRSRNTLGETVCVLQDLDRGLAIMNEAHDLARQSGNAHEQARALWNMQANRFFGGRLAEFVDNSERTIANLRITQPHWIDDHMVDTADALQMLGRWDEADAVIEAARNEYSTVANRLGVREMHLARGQFDEARALVEAQAEVLAGYVGPDVTGRVLILVSRADIAHAEGRHANAIALVEEALDRYPSLEKPNYISHGIAIGMRAAADLARTARLKGNEDGLEEAIATGERFHGRMMEQVALPGPEDGWRREVGCLAAQCNAELSRLHGRPDPDAWMRANDLWLELSMPYRAARCRFHWAEDSLASGVDRAEIEPALRKLYEFTTGLRARLLVDEIHALGRRARIDLGEGHRPDPYGLTEREREVLSQLATGSTNRQIAEALYISEKTASVHVSNILRKLTAANRGEAAATAIREGLVDVSELARGL